MRKSDNSKMVLVISSLAAGGAERVMSELANYWVRADRTVTLVTLSSTSSDFFSLHPQVERIALDLLHESPNQLVALSNNFERIVSLRRVIKSKRPQVVISFGDQTNVQTLLATRGLGIKVIVSERTDPASYDIGRLWHGLRRLTYPWADFVVAQTGQVKQWLERHVSGERVVVIPNPIHRDDVDIRTASLNEIIARSGTRRTVIAMGRLGPEKGFDMLLSVFARIAPANPEWDLVIFGEGAERSALERLAASLNIAERVYLPGRVRNPMCYLGQADIFVMSSRFEGFPNALLEAMACGLPVISFDCPNGPREIIRNEVDGLLVPAGEVDDLAAILLRLISNEQECRRLALKAPEVLERFGEKTVMGMWESLLRGEHI